MRISDWSSDVCSSDPRDDRRTGESTGQAAVLDPADEREALTQAARQRRGAGEADLIFAGGRLAPGVRIDGQAARGVARGVDVVIIVAEPLAIDIDRRRDADEGALRDRGAIFERRRDEPAAVAARDVLERDEADADLGVFVGKYAGMGDTGGEAGLERELALAERGDLGVPGGAAAGAGHFTL